MSTPTSLLVAVDFGDASARAVALAGAIAGHCHASLRLLHAETLEAPLYFTSEQIESLEAQRRNTRHQAEQFLAKFGRTHTAHPFKTEIADHTAVDAILRAASTADLVVMGTHGRRGARRWWLGSVAERVLREAGRPLLIVRAETPALADAAFHRALVHAAAPLKGDRALEYARMLAPCFSGEVVDARFRPVEAAIASDSASLLVAAAPVPATSQWLADYGEPLVRQCHVPILFVPDSEGESA